MDSRERIESLLSFREVDRIPVIPPFQGFWALVAAGFKINETFSTPAKGAEAQVKLLEMVPFDAFEVMWDWLAPVEACGCKVQIPEDGNPITLERVAKSVEDVAKLEVPDPAFHKRSMDDFENAAFLHKRLGGEGFTYITLVLPFTLSGELRGVEGLMIDIMKRPDEVHGLLRYSADVMIEYAKQAKSTGADAIFWCDPTASADLISPKQFKTFAAPYFKELIVKTKDLGMRAFLHICGNTADRLDTIIEASPDLMSVDTKVDLSKAMGIAGGRLPIMGNVSTIDLMMKKPGDIIEDSRKCIRQAGKIGFALGAGCDIPIGSPLENVRAMCDAVKT